MTKEEKKKTRLARAKRTALGRFLCRLAGDKAGAVMMEYVVLGVMVVAAVVALVMLFGSQIRASFEKMIDAIKGEPGKAAAVKNVSDEQVSGAKGQGRSVTGGEAKDAGGDGESSSDD